MSEELVAREFEDTTSIATRLVLGYVSLPATNNVVGVITSKGNIILRLDITTSHRLRKTSIRLGRLR